VNLATGNCRFAPCEQFLQSRASLTFFPVEFSTVFGGNSLQPFLRIAAAIKNPPSVLTQVVLSLSTFEERISESASILATLFLFWEKLDIILSDSTRAKFEPLTVSDVSKAMGDVSFARLMYCVSPKYASLSLARVDVLLNSSMCARLLNAINAPQLQQLRRDFWCKQFDMEYGLLQSSTFGSEDVETKVIITRLLEPSSEAIAFVTSNQAKQAVALLRASTGHYLQSLQVSTSNFETCLSVIHKLKAFSTTSFLVLRIVGSLSPSNFSRFVSSLVSFGSPLTFTLA